jgi:hypothetical protein
LLLALFLALEAMAVGVMLVPIVFLLAVDVSELVDGFGGFDDELDEVVVAVVLGEAFVFRSMELVVGVDGGVRTNRLAVVFLLFNVLNICLSLLLAVAF